MDAEELYAIIYKLPKENFEEYGVMVTFNEIYTALNNSKTKRTINQNILESDLKNLEKFFSDKIKLVMVDDMIRGVQFLN